MKGNDYQIVSITFLTHKLTNQDFLLRRGHNIVPSEKYFFFLVFGMGIEVLGNDSMVLLQSFRDHKYLEN